VTFPELPNSTLPYPTMVVLRNRKNTQEHQLAFTQAKQAKAKAKAEAKAARVAQAEAQAKDDLAWLQDWVASSAANKFVKAQAKAQAKAEAKAKAEAEAKAKAEAEAEAKAKAEADAKAEMQKKLDNKTNKILYQWQYGTGSMPTMAELAVVIQCYSDAGLPVPDCLTESLCYMLKGLETTSFIQHIPVYENDDADYSYKPWI